MILMQKNLTKLQAYNVMLLFLEKQYPKEESDYLGDILSNSEFWPSKMPGDRASWDYWKQAIRVISLQDRKFKNQNSLTALQACHGMFNYVDNYVSFYKNKPDYLINLLKILQSVCNKKDQKLWQLWLEMVDEILKREDPRVYLKFVTTK